MSYDARPVRAGPGGGGGCPPPRSPPGRRPARRRADLPSAPARAVLCKNFNPAEPARPSPRASALRLEKPQNFSRG